MTEEELERFALVLKKCERIRSLIAREEAALSNGEHDHGIPIAAAPQEQPASVLLAPDLRGSERGAAGRRSGEDACS